MEVAARRVIYKRRCDACDDDTRYSKRCFCCCCRCCFCLLLPATVTVDVRMLCLSPVCCLPHRLSLANRCRFLYFIYARARGRPSFIGCVYERMPARFGDRRSDRAESFGRDGLFFFTSHSPVPFDFVHTAECIAALERDKRAMVRMREKERV